MNYISLINKFWELDAEIHFSDKEIALYFHLLNTCNRLTWKNPFGQSNAMMIARFGWGKSSFDFAKKKLKDVGLIDFKPGDGRGNVYTYWICNIKVIKKVSRKQTLYDHLSKTLSDTLSETKPTTSIDLNKDLNFDATASSSESPAGSRTPGKEVERIDFKDLVVFFNTETKGVFGEIRYPLNEKRMSSVRARIREHGKEAFSEMVRKATASDFLKGGSKSGFRATFDWLVLPSNFQKVIEGNYENGNKHRATAGATVPADGRYEDAL